MAQDLPPLLCVQRALLVRVRVRVRARARARVRARAKVRVRVRVRARARVRVRARLLVVCCRVRAARPAHGAHLVAQRPALLPQLRLPDLQEEVVDLAWLGLG